MGCRSSSVVYVDQTYQVPGLLELPNTSVGRAGCPAPTCSYEPQPRASCSLALLSVCNNNTAHSASPRYGCNSTRVQGSSAAVLRPLVVKSVMDVTLLSGAPVTGLHSSAMQNIHLKIQASLTFQSQLQVHPPQPLLLLMIPDKLPMLLPRPQGAGHPQTARKALMKTVSGNF